MSVSKNFGDVNLDYPLDCRHEAKAKSHALYIPTAVEQF